MRSTHRPFACATSASRRAAVALFGLALVAGCGNGDGSMDASAATDMAASPVDQARLGGDAAGMPDLARPADLSSTPDQSSPADLAPPADLAVSPDLLDPPDLTMIGGACNCANNQFCKYVQRGSCAGAGNCNPRPQVCGLVLDPVCGCDGRDYDNECMANGAGTDIAHKGMCP